MTTSNFLKLSILVSTVVMLGLFTSCGDSLALEEPTTDLTETPTANMSISCEGLLGATGYGEIKVGTGVDKFSYHYNPNRPSRSRFVLTKKNGNVFKGVINSGYGYGNSHSLYGSVTTKNGNASSLYITINGTDVARRGADSDIFSYSLSNGTSRGPKTLLKGDITSVVGPCDDCCDGTVAIGTL